MATFSTALIRAIFDVCTGKIDTSAWMLPLNVILPFDQQSVFGWFLNWCLQLCTSIGYSVSMILTTTHFVCFCYYIIATCNHIDLLFEAIGIECEQIQKETNTRNNSKLWRNARGKFQQTIELHTQIYKYEFTRFIFISKKMKNFQQNNQILIPVGFSE